MKLHLTVLVFLLGNSVPCWANEPQVSKLVQNLDAGRSQTLVLYGTSLTAAETGWAPHLAAMLSARYGGRVRVVNAAKAGENSNWGLANLDERVLTQRPDTVTIEFAMNDAAKNSGLSVTAACRNLEAMISRIRAANPATEIILMTMNPVGAAVRARSDAHPYSRNQLEAHYQMVRKLAADRGLRLIDHHASWLRFQHDDPEGFERHVPDGVHPDADVSRTLVLPAMLRGLGLPEAPLPDPATSAEAGNLRSDIGHTRA